MSRHIAILTTPETDGLYTAEFVNALKKRGCTPVIICGGLRGAGLYPFLKSARPAAVHSFAPELDALAKKMSRRFGVPFVSGAMDVDTALCEYDRAERELRPYDVMLCGYYGRHNLGDDMSLRALSDNLKNVCGVTKKVIITTEVKPSREDPDTVFIHRFNLPKIYRYMKKCRMFILGSGSILQDATSSRSIVYYLHVLKKAMSLCMRTMLYSNGVGPINRERHRVKTTELLNKVMKIMVRDRKSVEFLREMGVRNPNIELAADETFTMDKSLFLREYPLENSKKYAYVDVENIPAHELSKQYKVTLTDGVNTMTIEFSAINYVNLNKNNADTSLSNLVKTVYRYSVEADKYYRLLNPDLYQPELEENEVPRTEW